MPTLNTTRRETPKLTDAQAYALGTAFKKGGAFYGRRRGTMGGAFRRMCERMALAGWVSDAAPFPITILGMVVLQQAWQARLSKVSCFAYADDLAKLNEALATVPILAGAAKQRLDLCA